MYKFDWFITPKIISFVFWLCMLSTVVWIIFPFGDTGVFLGFLGRFIYGVASIVAIRILLEVTMVAFKNNEYLRRIADALEKGDK